MLLKTDEEYMLQEDQLLIRIELHIGDPQKNNIEENQNQMM